MIKYKWIIHNIKWNQGNITKKNKIILSIHIYNRSIRILEKIIICIKDYNNTDFI